MTMKEFTINSTYLTSVTEHKEWNTYTKDGRVPTADELLLVLAGKGKCGVTSSKDHPEFAKLREQLGAEGYIHIERGWWNGDRVVEPFKLNGMKFKPGEQFSCAGALDNTFQSAKKHPEYYKDKFD